jgi:archaellum component FlaC
MMRRINRFIAWVIIVVVVVSILLAAMAIAGSWLVNQRITSEIQYILSGIQTGLSVLENSLQRLDAALSNSRDLVQTILSTADQLGARIEEGSPVLDLLTKTVNEDLVSKINAARETVIAIRDAVTAFNAALEAVNAIPFIDVPTLTDQLQMVSDRLADLALVVQELRGLVAQVKSGVVETLVTPITQTATRIDNELETIQATLQSFMQQVDNVQVAVATLQARVPVWIDIATIALSMFFLWVILAQFAMLAIARGYLRTGYLPWNYPLAAVEQDAGRGKHSEEAELPPVASQDQSANADEERPADQKAAESQPDSGEETGIGWES